MPLLEGMTRPSPYQWIIDRARSGEPVAIDTARPDIGRVIDFFATVDGRGLVLQLDTAAGLLWLSCEEPTP